MAWVYCSEEKIGSIPKISQTLRRSEHRTKPFLLKEVHRFAGYAGPDSHTSYRPVCGTGKRSISTQFCESLTLQAFEDRARGLRDWTPGTLPDQLVDRTVLSDPRQPSLLHLAVQRTGEDGRQVRTHLLVTDLPGEWTQNLVARAANAKSFEFLRRADGIILVVDGTVLTSAAKHVELQRMRNFSERLAHNVGINRDTPFVLLVSKADAIDMQEPAIMSQLRDHIRDLGFPVSIVVAAAFSRRPKDVKSGTGVFEAFETILSYRPTGERKPVLLVDGLSRSFQKFRG